jgi:glycosyltransferase involved in cell wall biosynthesis
MRVLLLARDLPFFPGGHGGNTRTFSLIRALSPRHRFTIVTNVYTAAHEAAAQELGRLVERVTYYRDPAVDAAPPPAPASPQPPWKRAFNSFRRNPAHVVAAGVTYARARLSWLPREASLWELSFANLRPALQDALARGPYDLLQIECSDNARWVTHFAFRGPKVLVVQDVKTVVWRRRLRSASSLRQRWQALGEWARFALYERRYLRQFDALLAMSEIDREHLRRLTRHPHIAVVPNGVDLAYYAPSATTSHPKRVIFTATLDHPPNRDGIHFFIRDIWPRISAAEPGVELDIVGANPSPELQALASDLIRVTGFVPDIRPYLEAASVFVCPLRFASGTRLKILEAMAMAKPVVATRVGAEGIDGRAGQDLHIADDPAEFAQRVVDLLRDPVARRTMGAAAQTLAARYDWQHCAERLHEVYTETRSRYVARRARQPLRVGLSGLFLVPGGATGGLDPYFRALVSQLLRLDHETQYVLLARRSNVLEFTDLRGENLRRHVVPIAPRSPGIVGTVARHLGSRMLHLSPTPPRLPADALAGLDLDLVHSFPGYIDPDVRAVPSVLTVADVQHEYYPEFFDEEELQARRALFAPSAHEALRVITLSAFTRRTLIERYALPAEKICVIPLGVHARFFAPVTAAHLDRVRQRYRLPAAYCVYPANLWPHKNHLRLLDAMRRLEPADRPHLVLTGAATRTKIPLQQAIGERDLSEHVTWLGFVDADELPALLAGARMMVFPSLFEGFGMPVVEAMAVGCPVACADATALPDTVGDAALRFDPLSADAIAAAIERMWRDATLRQQLQQAGSARARQFTWQRTALQTLQVYRDVGALVRS